MNTSVKYPRRLIATVLLATSLIACAGTTASAHVLESNNGVSAVLHITPDDDPTAGVATPIGLEFNSTIPGFDLGNYKTDIVVTGTSVSASSPAVTMSSDSSDPLYGTAQVTFPDPGTYSIVVHGVANDTARDKDFSITYEVRAERPVTTLTQNSTVSSAGFDSVMVGVASIGLLGIIAQYQIRQGGRYDKK